jgi:hypothetical protein
VKLESEEILVLLASLERGVRGVLLDHQDHLDHPERGVCPVVVVFLEMMVLLDQEGLLEKEVLKEKLVKRVKLVMQEILEQLDYQV